MTLLLHSLSANYNQYSGTRNQSQFGERGPGSIVITPGPRPGRELQNDGAADVSRSGPTWRARYRLDPDWTVITGYSMGGVGTFKLGSQFPDLFASASRRSAPGDDDLVRRGSRTNPSVLASLAQHPGADVERGTDELVPETGRTTQQAGSSTRNGYRYELTTSGTRRLPSTSSWPCTTSTRPPPSSSAPPRWIATPRT